MTAASTYAVYPSICICLSDSRRRRLRRFLFLCCCVRVSPYWPVQGNEAWPLSLVSSVSTKPTFTIATTYCESFNKKVPQMLVTYDLSSHEMLTFEPGEAVNHEAPLLSQIAAWVRPRAFKLFR